MAPEKSNLRTQIRKFPEAVSAWLVKLDVIGKLVTLSEHEAEQLRDAAAADAGRSSARRDRSLLLERRLRTKQAPGRVQSWGRTSRTASSRAAVRSAGFLARRAGAEVCELRSWLAPTLLSGPTFIHPGFSWDKKRAAREGSPC